MTLILAILNCLLALGFSALIRAIWQRFIAVISPCGATNRCECLLYSVVKEFLKKLLFFMKTKKPNPPYNTVFLCRIKTFDSFLHLHFYLSAHFNYEQKAFLMAVVLHVHWESFDPLCSSISNKQQHPYPRPPNTHCKT